MVAFDGGAPRAGPPGPPATHSRADSNAEPAERDLFRGTGLRYVAFSNDVGEAFKPFVTRRLYLSSYAIAAGYGLADAVHRAARAYSATEAGGSHGDSATLPRHATQCCPPLLHASSAAERCGAVAPAAAALAEAAVWHGLASLLLPGVAINRTVWAAGQLVARMPRLPARAVRALPTAAGLAAIPLLVPHIDARVEAWVGLTVRPALAHCT